MQTPPPSPHSSCVYHVHPCLVEALELTFVSLSLSQAPTPLPDVSPLVSISSTCDTDGTPSTTSPKEMRLAEDSVTFPLELEPPLPINGQQIFLPLFPTSPVRVSPPPPAPPALHLQTHPALVFSVITHTTAEKAASTPGAETLGGTFAVPMSSPLPKGGRRRQLQRIAPAPTSSCPPAPSSSFLTQLLRQGRHSLACPGCLELVRGGGRDGGGRAWVLDVRAKEAGGSEGHHCTRRGRKERVCSGVGSWDMERWAGLWVAGWGGE